MFEVGFTEIILILGLALLVLGPEKLPGLAEKIGRWTGRARSMARQLRSQLEHEVTLEELAKSKPMQASPQPSPSPAAAAEPAHSNEFDFDHQAAAVDTSPEAMHGPRAAAPTSSAAGTPETDPQPAELDTTPEAMHGTWKNKAQTSEPT
jgi:sec-independent protein translocase protein TatB